MSIIINRDSFIVAEILPLSYKEGTFATGTIEATFAGKTVTVEASLYDDGDVFLKGFVGRYVTSPKAWRATVTFRAGSSEKPFVNFGRDDRSGRFNKNAMIRYEPETYKNV